MRFTIGSTVILVLISPPGRCRSSSTNTRRGQRTENGERRQGLWLDLPVTSRWWDRCVDLDLS